MTVWTYSFITTESIIKQEGFEKINFLRCEKMILSLKMYVYFFLILKETQGIK